MKVYPLCAAIMCPNCGNRYAANLIVEAVDGTEIKTCPGCFNRTFNVLPKVPALNEADGVEAAS